MGGGAGGGGGGGGGHSYGCSSGGGGGGGGAAGEAGGGAIEFYASELIEITGVIVSRSGGAQDGTSGQNGTAYRIGVTKGPAGNGGAGGNSNAAGNGQGGAGGSGATDFGTSDRSGPGGAGGNGGVGAGGGIFFGAPVVRINGGAGYGLVSAGWDGRANNGTFKVAHGPNGYANSGTLSNCRFREFPYANKFQPPAIAPLNPAPSSAASVLVTITGTDGLSADMFKITYTTNGSAPDCNSAEYTGPFSVTTTTTVRAMACAKQGGWDPSDVAQSTISLYACTPSIALNPSKPVAGYYQTEPVTVNVSLPCGTVAGSVMRYTVNGGDPDGSAPICPASFQVSSNAKIRVRAFVEGRAPSAVALEEVRFKVQNPVFGPVSPYSQVDPYGVSLTSATLGAVNIRYSTDEVCPPPQESPSVTNGGAVPITGYTLMRAQGFRSGWDPSDAVPECSQPAAEYRRESEGVVFNPPAGFSSNAPYRVTLTCPEGSRICFTLGTDASFPAPQITNRTTIVIGQDLTNGGSLLISNSPMYIKAIAYRTGLEPSAMASGGWRNIGTNAPQGEEILGPPGFGVQQAPLYTTYTSTDPTVGSFPWRRFAYVASAGKVFGVVEGNDKVRWWFPALGQYVQFEHVVTEPLTNEIMVVYHTDSGAPPQLPVSLSQVPSCRIYYNETLPGVGMGSWDNTNTPYLWITDRHLYAAQKRGRVVMEYQDGPSGPFVGMVVLETRPYQEDPLPNVSAVQVGEELNPLASPTRRDRPWVTRGLNSGSYGDQAGDFVYQHPKAGPFDGRVFSIRETTFAYSQVEVVWTRRDRHNRAVWPYEIRHYAASWPASPQRYVIARSGENTGPTVAVPASIRPVLMDYQVQADGSSTKHANLGGRVFSATKPGLSLLRYELDHDQNSDDWVGFQVVRTVYHDDTTYFDLALKSWPIGTEVKTNYHQAPWPGYIHLPYNWPLWDRYAPELYGQTFLTNAQGQAISQPGQIFGVNVGNLEVWWYNQFNNSLWPNGMNVYWPSLTCRYTNQWPVNPGVVDIADQCGSGPLNEGIFNNRYIYYQNEPTLPGYNPNDEHAFFWPVADGVGAFALRNDLGSANTSLPYLLVPYRVNASNGAPWNILVFHVTAGTFNYIGTAGTRIQPPLPLNAFTDLTNSYPVSGPYWRDRKKQLWVRAAGDDGGLSGIVTRYFYMDRPDAGFFYPDFYPRPASGIVPWLDLLARQRGEGNPGTNGQPINIAYTCRWPDLTNYPAGLLGSCGVTNVDLSLVPELLIEESLVRPKRGLPAIEGQKSVEILYQQSIANGRGESTRVIDPTRTYYVTGVPNLPADVRKINYQDKVYFFDLPPHLQQRLWFEPLNNRLAFKGQFIAALTGEDYLQLNVVGADDRTRILALTQDAAFRAKLIALANQASQVITLGSQDTAFDSMALTAGFAQGNGYVTLAFGNNTNLTQPADPVELAVIRVTPPLYVGDLKAIYPPSPYDEKITLRHSADFKGRPEQFQFEWRFSPGSALPPFVADNLNLWPTSYRPSDWTDYPVAANGVGIPEVVIEGANVNTLGDNWFICRYRPINPSHPLYNQWSDWTRPQLAEGWVKRVLAGINPYEQRYGNYKSATVNTIVSMISQAGRRWEGDIPFNISNADDYGLIETYESVFNRAMELSVNGTPPINFTDANMALMLVGSRLSDLYMLLGNEAYADAVDPTIAFGTSDGQFGAQASSLFCFMNQMPDLLGEEIALLRGRDDSSQPGTRVNPVYNRLYWNITRDIAGGQVAYVLNYGIRDQAWNRTNLNLAAYSTLVDDAARLYPQGHGDAWGHYLTAVKVYYRLLSNPNFSWVPRIESVLVGGQPVSVDYYDERRFASAAAARARTGSEIVNLTYRERYVENPEGQWQGYFDSDTNRAWGLSEWAMRAGQGAYLDWVMGNAIIPDVDPDVSHTGIQKIDRTTVPELAQIAAAYRDVEAKLGEADAGLNPLGVAKGAVPFDISASELSGANPKTHFEQIYDRSVANLNNAIAVFNHAYNSAQQLRKQADEVYEFQKNTVERNIDFKNRLIEVFGYPYPDDIGPSRTYDTGYDGPDLYHFMYFDPSELLGKRKTGETEFEVNMLTKELKLLVGGSIPPLKKMQFNMSTEGFGFVKPSVWTLPRRAQGEIQMAHSDLLQSYGRIQKALKEYDNLIDQIGDQGRVVRAQAALNSAERAAGEAEVQILNTANNQQMALNALIVQAREKALSFQNKAAYANIIADATAEALYATAGVLGIIPYADLDVAAIVRGAIRLVGTVVGQIYAEKAQKQGVIELEQQQAKEIVQAQANIDIVITRNGVIDPRGNVAMASAKAQLKQLVRGTATLELEIFNLEESLEQSANRYLQVLAKGQRLLDDWDRFQAQTASDVQQYRYKDMAFRIFRNDGIQKYRAQFDLAARYVYLAAKAYDYETGLLGEDSRSAQDFLNQLVRSRSLGLIVNGQPVTGSGQGDPGLADAMARMSGSWQVLKSRLGFNNPNLFNYEFSLRYELLRILPGAAGNAQWRELLQRSRVNNLLDYPEFRRFCIAPQGATNAVEPGLVIPFTTTINNGLNFFGQPLAGGDHAYPSTHFAVKIHAGGVGFVNYDSAISAGLSATPYVYLVPAGEDQQRVATDEFSVRSWQVIDQILPVPFAIGSSTVNDPDYIPIVDSLTFGGNSYGRLRLFPQIPAYHDGSGGTFNPSSASTLSSRLIGRSVWNSRWLLFIPGSTFKANATDGLDQFINGRLLPTQLRDGNGVTDVRIRFDAYSYSGN
jgi:hypothetical protein